MAATDNTNFGPAPLQTPINSDHGLSVGWAAWFNAAYQRLLSVVRGGANLTHVGAIPTVSAAGTLTESAITDDGSNVNIAARNFVLDNNQVLETYDSAHGIRSVLFIGAENPDILHIRNGQRGVGGSIQFEGAAGAVKVAMDATGNLNLATGVLQVAGTQVVGARQAAISAPAGGTVIDVQARAAIVSLINELHAHGLIG